MRKSISIFLVVAIVLSVFALPASASDSEIMPLSDAVYWGPTTITTTSQWVTSGDKNDTTSADVFFNKSYYPAGHPIEIRIYDYTAGRVAASWDSYTPASYNSTYYKVSVPYNSGRAISGHVYVLNLQWPSSGVISSYSLQGVFYP